MKEVLSHSLIFVQNFIYFKTDPALSKTYTRTYVIGYSQ